jgi:hypothetical protein
MVLVGSASASDNWETKVNEEGKNVQSLQIQAPSMTEEDQYGYTMPDQYRCDSCKVVVHHVSEALKRKQPKNRRLKEWEYHEVFDETCKTGFSGYGISLVNGQNVLSGPALKRDNLEPGMGAIQMGGETWEKRLGEQCRKFVYEKIGEDEVYDHFREHGEVSEEMCFAETRDCKKPKLGPEIAIEAKKVKKSSGEKKARKTSKAPELDASAFMSQLAKKHGLAPTAYTAKRSFAEWEQVLLQASKRIPGHRQEKESPVVEV